MGVKTANFGTVGGGAAAPVWPAAGGAVVPPAAANGSTYLDRADETDRIERAGGGAISDAIGSAAGAGVPGGCPTDEEDEETKHCPHKGSRRGGG